MENLKPWIISARKFLAASLDPVPHELNELDWKGGLSPDSEKTAQHLSAFANQEGGGVFVFGISPAGEIKGVSQEEVTEIIKLVGNIARDKLEPSQKIDHLIETFRGHSVLYVFINESPHKPVHLRGKGIEFSYIRSGGQTRKMSRQELAGAILASHTARYEELEALSCTEAGVFKLLDNERLFTLLGLQNLSGQEAELEQLINHKLVYRNGSNISISNLGAVVAARDFSAFPGKERLSFRVIKYRGSSRIETEVEKEFTQGYAVVFQDLIKYIMSQLPTSEVIKDALRKDAPVYPEIAVRELVANALIHRDFTITATNPMAEIFSDRMEISNPGTLLPTVKIERIIDSAPESRNEMFASLMRRLGVCEERGSGIDKALFAVEMYGLPPIDFVEGPNAFKAILYRPRSFKHMSQEERLRACYQHCCLKYLSNEYMTNSSLRKRLGLRDGQYPIVWRIIDLAIDRRFIKPADMASKSKRFARYTPAWA